MNPMDHSGHHTHPMATPTSGGHDHGGNGGQGGHMSMVSGAFFSARSLRAISRPKRFRSLSRR